MNDVSFDVSEGETLGLAGESGCGKSVTALSIMRLIPSPPGVIESGEVLFQGQNLLQMPDKDMQGIRGPGIGMIFQEPMSSLNPVLSVGRQISEPLEKHLGLTAKKAFDRAVELLDMVGIADPRRRLSDFPHQLSGGQRQRLLVARALVRDPEVILLDEPTSALDFENEREVLRALDRLVEGRTSLIIAHRLSTVRSADRVIVMRDGRIVADGSHDMLYETDEYYRALCDFNSFIS